VVNRNGFNNKDLGDNTTYSDSINFFYNYAEPGIYTPGAYLYDSTGCEVFYPLPPITVLDDGLNAFFTYSPDPAEQNELITFVDASSSDQSVVVAWIWDFGPDIISTAADTNQTYSYPIAGQYEVSLTIFDALGCQDVYTTIINISDPEIWVPNVITINDDGSNDLFTLPFDAFKDYTVYIVNRWGNLIHEGNRDPNNPILMWDGTTDSSGDKVVDGVYFYKLIGEMLGGTQVTMHGHVTVRESGQ
jgi:gliding motility-associated-like protein